MAEFSKFGKEHEVYVVRVADVFNYIEFRRSIAKFVRIGFGQKVDDLSGYWASKKIEVNGLAR